MKKIIYSIICVLVIGFIGFWAIYSLNMNNDNSDLVKVRVAEVAHSIFYAQQYADIS